MIWRAYALDDVVAACAAAPPHVERVCISMITRPEARQDTLEVCRRVRAGCDLPVSLLIAPTLLKRDNLLEMKDAGADRIGVAIDAATPELFAKYRGKPAGGPTAGSTTGTSTSSPSRCSAKTWRGCT